MRARAGDADVRNGRRRPRRASRRAHQKSRSDGANGKSGHAAWWTKPARSPKAARVSPRLFRLIQSPKRKLLSAAASVEQNSEHPLAAAVVNSARERGESHRPAVVDFQSTTGGGVMGRVNGRRVLVGKPAFLRAQHVAAVSTQLETKASPLQHQGEHGSLRRARRSRRRHYRDR